MRPFETVPTSRLLILAGIVGVALFLAGRHGCRPDLPPTVDPGAVVENEPPAPGEPPVMDEPSAAVLDGLPQHVFDNALRVRNRSGSGSGSVVDETETEYEVETNHHVANRRGTANVLDIWIGGDLVASRPTVTAQSWFQDGKSKDIAVLRIKKSDLGGPLSVVPTAPKGFAERIVAGDKVFTVGCQSGQSPRARCGNVLKAEDGLIWYEPESIPGDSGSGVYMQDADSGAWYCVGRTAWAIQERGKWVGLAMDSDRVRAIRAGEVSDGWDLPEGAVPLDRLCPVANDPIALPMDAIRLDLMQPAAPPKGSGPDDAQPIPVGVRNWSLRSEPEPTGGPFLRRLLGDQESRLTGEVRAASVRGQAPIRKALAGAVWLIGLAVAASTFLILISLRQYLPARV